MHVRDTAELRRLACWYRDFAERAGNPTIWEARLGMAEDLEREAQQREQPMRKELVRSAKDLSCAAAV
jgi:hypothetical protein